MHTALHQPLALKKRKNTTLTSSRRLERRLREGRGDDGVLAKFAINRRSSARVGVFSAVLQRAAGRSGGEVCAVGGQLGRA